MKHVVWDWNGTLVDDLPIVVECVNAALAQIGEGPIVADDYRNHFARPVHRFYDSLLQRPISNEEWTTLDRVFHERYAGSVDRVPLADGAIEAMDAVDALGWSQSILSMWWEEDLVACVARRGLDDRMVLIQGNRNDMGGTKASHLARHLDTLGIAAASAVMIGDSLDDEAAAREVGARCVLYDGGSHHPGKLRETGAPVAVTLVDAVELAAQFGQ